MLQIMKANTPQQSQRLVRNTNSAPLDEAEAILRAIHQILIDRALGRLKLDSVGHLQSEFVLHRPKRTLHGLMLRRVERCGLLRCSWWEYVTDCKGQIVQGYELCSLLWTKTD